MKKLNLPLAAVLLAALPSVGRADSCPPSASDFTSWTWLSAGVSGDTWMKNIVCASNATRDAAKNLVVNHMGLDENWSSWEDMMSRYNQCNANDWALRAVNGGYAMEYVSIQRDNDTFAHFASPGVTMPNGDPVTRWLSQFSSYYISDEGYEFECLDSDDDPGPSDGFTFASNPSGNFACSVYYPWFWNKTVTDRASTIAHEASHEFEGHLDDDECDNGASCDTAFMVPNAQTVQIIFDAQAVDAYQREPNSRELKVVGYGNAVCGYLPALPDAERFSLVQVMRSKLQNVFRDEPPQSAWPSSAFVDTVSDAIYDVASQPGGNAGQAYRIDMVNGAMWPCEAVCNVADYTYNPNGGSGPRACNEDWQPGNAERNAENRQRCTNLNAQVAAGVTPAERANLRSQALNGMRGCISGLSADYIGRMCLEALHGAMTVDDVAEAWPIPDNLGYMYDEEQSIRSCQAEFCQGQPLGSWNEEAFGACYEWDDPAGCMELACGDLSTIEAEKGRESIEYLNALVCRASELGRNIESLEDADQVCERTYRLCEIRENYLPHWLAQLNEGEDCWAQVIPDLPDPFHRARRAQIGLMDPNRYVISDRGVGLLLSPCAIEQMQCEAMQAALQALLAKLSNMKAEQRDPWRGPPVPDPWEDLQGRFDRELISEMSTLGGELISGMDADIPLARNQRLTRAANMPEARVAMAEFVGHDLYFSAGGAQNAEGIFAPERLATFNGPNAARDPYGLDIEGAEAEVAALQTLNERVGTDAWQALLAQAGGLDGAVYYGHLIGMLEARDGVALLAAHDALQQDLQALAR
jgi:hypothetical protein